MLLTRLLNTYKLPERENKCETWQYLHTSDVSCKFIGYIKLNTWKKPTKQAEASTTKNDQNTWAMVIMYKMGYLCAIHWPTESTNTQQCCLSKTCTKHGSIAFGSTCSNCLNNEFCKMTCDYAHTES